MLPRISPTTFSLFGEIPHDHLLFSTEKLRVRLPVLMNVCVPSDSVENQSTRSARGTAKLISYRGKVVISPLHTDFPRFPSLFIWRKLVDDKSGWLSLRLLQFVAAQHLCPTFFLFFNICSEQVAINLYTSQFFPNSFDISSAILVARGLLSLACMQLPVFSGIGVLTSQLFPVSCFWCRGFVPHRKWNLTLLAHQNTGKENRYRKIFFGTLISTLGRFNRAN